MALALAALFWGSLGSVIVPLATRVLVGLGFAAVTYAGVGLLWDQFRDNIIASMSSVASSIVTILIIARVDDAMAIIFSAIAAKLALAGLTAAGSIKRVHYTGGAPIVLN